MKQETLEKAAFRFYPEDEQWTDRHIFTLGAKWQQEQDKNVYLNGYVDGSRAQAKLMYSEEEVLEIIRQYALEEHLITSSKPDIWFKQFKNK